MAEVIVKLVMNKLIDATVREALYLYGARDKLDSLHHELSYIQAFLQDAESKLNSANERVKTWVNDVREVAYRIEDVIDTFVAEIDKRNRPGKVNTLKHILQNPKKLPIVHKLISEMDEIQTRLREIKELTERYGINRELGDNNSSSVQPFIKPPILPHVDDPDIIGLEKDTESIVERLLNPSITRRCVVSIVGQGGLGKTTLAKKAFNRDEVKTVFQIRLWLSVSQQFDIVDLMKRILENIRSLSDDEKALKSEGHINQQRAIEQLSKEIFASLSKKRYLIIMDDVWTENLWTKIKVALPDEGNGSRVLVTTRSSSIALKADPACDPYQLRCLSEKESRDLLLKKAFPFTDPEPYLHDLSDLPDKLAKKCGYLPLALVVVGGLLSTKPKAYNSWFKIFESFDWNDEGRECTGILTTSYEDLPVVLKPCFMYFGLFPEDHKIKVKPLIRMWVAEGFMPKEDKKTMEEIAEGCLEELVQRSMIQVSERSLNGSIRYCRIHDLLHELAIKKGKESRFLDIISTQDGSSSSSTVPNNVRHASLHNSDRKNITDNTGPNLRSLLLFGEHDFSDLKMFRFLKVLNGLDSSMKGTNLKKLAQLRYIALWELRLDSHCGLTILAERQIWKGLGCMRNLQTLYIGYVEDGTCYLIDCIWDIKTLRHVIVDGDDSIYGPPSRAELPNLQTLKTVAARKEWVTKGWPRMPSIRVLKICGLSELPPNYQFCTFLNGLHHLTSLTMDNKDIAGPLYFDPRDMSKFPWYHHLQSLNLDGQWIESTGQESVPVTVSERSFPIHLTKLRLVDSGITEDPMPILERLESLSQLQLLWHAYVGRELCCSAGGFPRLQILIFDALQELEEWKVDVGDGAMPSIMPMLKEIYLTDCPKLRLIPGLRYMTSLNKFTSVRCSPDLERSLCEDESHQIREGQFVEFDISNG